LIKITAVLCSLASSSDCRQLVVITSDFAGLSLSSCLMGAPKLAEWVKQHRAERLAAWRRVDGQTGWAGGLGWSSC